MRTLAAVILGTVILASLMVQGNAEDIKQELELQLSGAGDIVDDVRSLVKFVYSVITLSVKVILSGLNTPGNLNVVLIVSGIATMVKQLIEGIVQLVAYVAGRLLKNHLPSPTVNSLLAAIPPST